MRKVYIICYTLLVSLMLIIGCGEDEEDAANLDVQPPTVTYLITPLTGL